MINNYINHIVFVVDKSGSMQNLQSEIVKVFDSQIKHLATRSKELDQETRVSVYLFADKPECICYDIDVLRLPSLATLYRVGGQTALLDATGKALEDLEKTATLYGDHAFLMYALTDGQENASRNFNSTTLSARLKKLPENWTVAVLVPDQDGKFEAKKAGFPADNIQVWSTTRDGIREVGEVLRQSTNQFMQARSTGMRGTKNLFSLDASNLNSNVVKAALEELKSSEFEVIPVRRDEVIKPFVESWMKEYRIGSAYYMLTKPESVQAYKQICIQNKRNGKVYAGAQARQLLGLPDHEVKVSPATHPEWDCFVQSTSTNRKLQSGTKLLVMK